MRIARMFQIETNNYENAHGKKPKGFGCWMFEIREMIGDKPFRYWVAPPTSMNYGKACKWCRKWIGTKNISWVKVGS